MISNEKKVTSESDGMKGTLNWSIVYLKGFPVSELSQKQFQKWVSFLYKQHGGSHNRLVGEDADQHGRQRWHRNN